MSNSSAHNARGRGAIAIGALCVAALLLAACGGSGSPGVANVGSTTTTTSAAQSSSNAPGSKIVAYSRCMQTHGVPGFPLPIKTAGGYSIRITPALDPSSPRFQSAQSNCQKYLPNKGVGPTITPADQADYCRAVACMRSHGFPAFPDPTISKNQVHFTVPSNINQGSSQFKTAVTTCEKIIPAGLPYSGTS